MHWMKRLSIVLLTLCLAMAVPAQQKTAAGKRKAVAAKPVARKQAAKPAAKTAAKKQAATRQKGKTLKQQPVTVQSLKNQRQQLQKQIQEQQRKLRDNERNVKERLRNLMVINTEIDDKRKTIDTIRHDIGVLSDNIVDMDKQLKVLEKELDTRKQRYMKSMRYMHRNRNIHSQLMFVFSAHNFSQMYRRMRFMREYAVYQRAQGEAVKVMQDQVSEAVDELTTAKKKKDDLLYRGEQEKKALEGKQVEQQNVVSTLQKQQKTIQNILSQQQKKDAELNAQIDKMIAEEIARAKARAEAERKRKEAEAAAKKRAEELARKKAAAEAAARKKAKEETTFTVSSEDRRLSGNFESNRGRLPMPITGGYQIVNRFGQYAVEGLKGNVTLDNKGINIKGQSGAQARSVFDGTVSTVFNYSGSWVVIVSHGTYLSVYTNLSNVSVSQGQKVSVRQALGRIGGDGIMQFQLRRGSTPLNPLSWLGR